MLRLLRRLWHSGPASPVVPEVGESPLWQHLCREMEENALWKDPDLSLDRLSRLLQSNKTTLSRLYHSHGTTFWTDLQERRIGFVLKGLEENHALPLETLFFEAGYRTYSTGWRQFRRITGVSPSTYVQQIRP